MIHSLSGGILKQNATYNFAKVELVESCFKGNVFWYILNIDNVKENDFVLVPFGQNNTLIKAVVKRIDKNVNEQVAPINIKSAKYILKKCE